MESIDLGGGRLHFDRTSKLARLELVLLLHKAAHHFASFQVRFSVQITGVNVADAVRVARLEQQDVRGHRLVVGQVDDVANADVLPQHFLVTLQISMEKKEKQMFS